MADFGVSSTRPAAPAPCARLVRRKEPDPLRRLAATIALIAGGCQAAAAAVTGQATLFTTVCIDEQVTGFDWQNGAWVPGMFYPNKYTLQKRDPKSDDCVGALQAVPSADTFFSDVTVGCYTITDFGMAPGPPIG